MSKYVAAAREIHCRNVGCPNCRVGKSWEVLTHYEVTLKFFDLCGDPLEPVQGLWGHVNLCQWRHDERGGTQA